MVHWVIGWALIRSHLTEEDSWQVDQTIQIWNEIQYERVNHVLILYLQLATK